MGERVKRYEGIDVEGLDGAEGWGCGLRTDGDGDTTMVLYSDYEAAVKGLREALDAVAPREDSEGKPCYCDEGVRYQERLHNTGYHQQWCVKARAALAESEGM